MAGQARGGKNKDNARRAKKKISILNQERVDYVDYKDVNLLRRFMSDRAKIRARRVTGNNAQQQKRGRHRDQERPRDGAAALRQPDHAAAWRPWATTGDVATRRPRPVDPPRTPRTPPPAAARRPKRARRREGRCDGTVEEAG